MPAFKIKSSKKIVNLLYLTVAAALILVTSPLLTLKLPFTKTSPGFDNVIKASGINKGGHSFGASWVDYNNDNFIDLFISGGRDASKLFKNNGNGTFTDKTNDLGLQGLGEAWSGVFGDYDNDGCQDLYITVMAVSDRGKPDFLFKGSCGGTFRNVTSAAGINDSYSGRGAAWADYNSDGFLDIYVANYGNTLLPEYISEPNILYRNNRDGTFTNVTDKAGVMGFPHCPNISPDLLTDRQKKVVGGPFKQAFQPIWFDYNGDDLIDLFVATDSSVSPLYRNKGDGTFEDVTYSTGLCKLGTGMGVTVGDYDNDLDLDLYVTNVGANFFWRNNGDGSFDEIGIRNETADTLTIGWGTSFLDYDNDGDLDLYVTNGQVSEGGGTPFGIGRVKFDRLFQNNGDSSFTDISQEAGIKGNDQKEAAAFADYNNDGFTDIAVISGNMESKAQHRLYKNRTADNNWLTIKLVGTESNRDGVGVKILIKVGGKYQLRQVINSSSYISQNSPWQTFGLGKAEIVNEIEVSWPSGKRQVLQNIKPNQKITVTEP